MNKEIKISGLYHSDIPIIISIKDSYIAAANPAAISLLRHFSEGERLFDHMLPGDILRYQASLDSGRVDFCKFPLTGFHPFKYAVAFFDLIMGRRYSAVLLFKSEEESRVLLEKISSEKSKEGFGEEIFALVEDLLQIPDFSFEREDREGLWDVKTVFEKALDRYMKERADRLLSVDIQDKTETSERELLISDVPLRTFFALLFLLISAAGEISADRRITLILSEIGGSARIDFSVFPKENMGNISSVDTLMDIAPCLSPLLLTANYMAGAVDCSIGAHYSRKEEKLRVSLVMGEREIDIPDFKSRNQLESFDCDFDFAFGAVKDLLIRYKEEVQG